MKLLQIFGFGLLGMAIVLLIVPVILRSWGQTAFFKRSGDFHHVGKTSIPRLGGLALAAAFLGVQFLAAIFTSDPKDDLRDRWVILLSSLAMFGIGFWDDLKPLGARKKLLGQILVATVVYTCGIGIENLKNPLTEEIFALHGWGALLTILWLVAVTNLIN